MAQYRSFREAYDAKNKPAVANVAESTWGTGRQALADAYSAKNPTWSPDPSYGVTVNPATFDPYGDPGYAATGSAVETRNQHAQTEHTYQGHNYAQTYGYDSEGRLIDTSANPDYNPYSQAAILKKNYDNSVRGTTNSYASNGQLYSGAIANAQGTNDWNYGVSSDQLKRAATNAYHGNDQTLQGTQDAGMMQMAQVLGPAFAAYLAGQRGY